MTYSLLAIPYSLFPIGPNGAPVVGSSREGGKDGGKGGGKGFGKDGGKGKKGGGGKAVFEFAQKLWPPQGNRQGNIIPYIGSI